MKALSAATQAGPANTPAPCFWLLALLGQGVRGELHTSMLGKAVPPHPPPHRRPQPVIEGPAGPLNLVVNSLNIQEFEDCGFRKFWPLPPSSPNSKQQQQPQQQRQKPKLISNSFGMARLSQCLIAAPMSFQHPLKDRADKSPTAPGRPSNYIIWTRLDKK